MSEVGFIEKSTLEAIGAAVRNKEGSTDLIPVNTLADRIAALPSNKLPQVIDGTIIEITAEDFTGATKIRDYAFFYCRSLKSVTIPDSVTDIGDEAFGHCNNLTSITIGDGVLKIDNYAFRECGSLTSVTIGDRVWRIGTGAFQKCTSLTSVTIPNSVRSIYTAAFEDCSNLTSVTVGNSVTSIGSWGLKIGSSTNKATIIFLGVEPPSIQKLTFKTDYLNKIIVPKGCGETYKSATNWANFADFIEEAAE